MEDGEKFCPSCGTPNGEAAKAAPDTKAAPDMKEAAVPQFTPPPQFEPNAPFLGNDVAKEHLAGQTLVWGILSLAFSMTFCLSILGFIFSFVQGAKAKTYRMQYGELDGRARVGNILGRVGFGVGLALTILFTLYVFIIFIALAETVL